MNAELLKYHLMPVINVASDLLNPGNFAPNVEQKREADGENDPAIKTALMQLAEKIRFSDPISNETLTDLENGILARILE